MKTKILNQLYVSLKQWKTLVLIGMLLTFGVGLWATDYNGETHVYLNVDGTTKYYKVSTESWTCSASLPGTWGGVLKDQTFSNIHTLEIKGGGIGGWTSYGDQLSGSLSYKVTQSSSTPASWDSFGSITSSSAYNGDNCFYYKNNGSTNVTPHAAGTYYLHIKISYNSTSKTSYVKFTIPSYTVAGSSTVLGTNWDQTDTDNDMVWSNGTTYTLTKSNVSLTKGTTYEYKVALNHAWTTAYPASNASIDFGNTTGHYDVTFTFNASTHAVSATATRLYAVTYDGNSPTSGTAPATTYHANGATVTVASNSGSLAKTGYDFGGWNTNSSGTGSNYTAGSGTFTMGSADKPLYAKWDKKKFTVTVNNDGNGTTSPSGAQSNIAQVDGVAISATPDDGYEFTNWTIVSGSGTFTGGGTTSTSASTTFYPTSAATIRANFSSTATSTLTVTATVGGSITTPAAGYYSDISETSYSIAASRSEGYKFTGWSKTAGDGAVSFANSNSLSTTATITTLGDVTVTASFAQMSNSLSVSSSTLYAGDNITLTATKTNHTLDLTYQYKIGSGAWTDIATQSGTSKTWQIPYANTYQTYKFRVKSTDGSTSFYSAEQTVNVKGRIIIHVKNTNSWASMYLYSWYSTSTTTNGAWPGKTGTGLNNQSCSIHATGSQWWDVTITQETATAQKFILNCNTSGDQYKTGDLSLSSFTHDAYYTMSTNSSAVQTLSTTTTPTEPTVTDLAAGTIRETSAMLGGKINATADLGNDIISERGYYWSTNSALSSSNLSVGTKVTISGTQSTTGNFTSSKTGLTAGTKYYFIAYAKNGYGTGYSSVQNFTTLSTYTVTVTAGVGGSASPSSVTAGQYLASETITASPSAGYTFYNWTKTSGTGTVTFTNANANSTTVKATSDATVQANFVDTWNLKGDQWSSWDYQPMAATANANEYSKSFTLTKGTKYQFKVIKRVDNNGANDVWYGNTDDAGNKVFERGESAFTTVADGMNNNLEVTPDVTGTYTFTINTSGSTPVFTLTFPTAYTITYGVGTIKGCSTVVSVSPSFTSGDYVLPETDVTFAKGATKTGYTWKGWYPAAGGTGTAWSTTDGSLTLTATRTGNINVYACYNYATYTVTMRTSDRTGYGSGAPTNQTGTYTQAMPTITPPTAAAGYCFMGYWDGEEGTGTQYYNANGTSAHVWNKTSGGTLYAYFQKAEITSLEHNATVAKATTAYLVVNPVLNVTPTNYVDICWTLHYKENDNEVAGAHWSVAPYTESGSKPRQVRFTLTDLAVGSYYVKAVLKASASSGFDACSAGTLLDTKTGDFNIVGSSTVTIRYLYYGTGDYIASNGSVEIEAEGNAEITAPNIVGYTFREWSLGAGVTLVSGELSNATITISSPYDGVVTAFYNKRDVIYFNNTLGWEDVWVYFYNDGSGNEYWASGYGTGANQQQEFNYNKPFYQGEYGHMTQIEGTNVWYFDYKAASWYSTTRTKVAFANKDQKINKSGATNAEAYFHNASVVYRTDFDATHLPMFVPINAVKHDYTTNTGSKYYHGYWMNYPDNTGYTLKIYNKKTKEDTPDKGSNPIELKSIPFTFSANKAMPMNLTVDLEAGKTYGFKIYRNSNDDQWYGNGGTMKNGSSGDSGQTAWEATTSTTNCGLKTTSTGDYVFTLRYGLDNYGNYNYLIGVKYPEAVGNHRVVYTDNANWSGTAHVAQTWTLESRVIPALADATDTVSFFVSKGSSPQFKIEKVTEISGEGVPTWSTEVDWTSCNDVAAAGVYNFIMTQDGSMNMTLTKKELYDGNFYIRADGAGTTDWEHYRSSDHIMPYSEYSFNQTNDPYSHYYTHWYDCTGESKNIKFVVANDYSPRLTDYIARDGIADSYVDTEGNLSRSANVRFMYNYKTNVATRRYVDGAYASDNDFLLLIPSDDESIYETEEAVEGVAKVRFKDNGNWIYEADVYVVPNTQYKLKSVFGVTPAISQYLKGKASGTGEYETLIGGSGSRMKIRLLYDFKTNRLIAAYLPSGTIDENMVINADIMFERVHQGDVTQITFGENKSISAIQSVYTTLKFNKGTINNLALSRYERDMFYVSFPYNVLVSDIIGFGTYGTHWIIEYYDGADRAEKGFWKDSKTFWKFVTPAMASSFTLKAGTGYIVALDLDVLGNTSTIWANTSTVELIFPGNISSISNKTVTYDIPKHQCNIGPRFEGGDDRRIADSHWNVLGIPAYHNTTGTFENHTDEIGNKSQVWSADGKPNYLYTWNMTDNSLSVTSAAGYNYKAMHAYIVQYYGKVTFTTSTNSVPSSVAARVNTDAPSEVEFRLEIQHNDVAVDQTFVTLSNEDEVSNEFVFGEDMSKEFNKNKANIYTMVTTILNDTATVTEVAGNTLPMSKQTTIVPVGVKVVEDGEYIFSMPDGTEGVGVTLIDKERGTRTSLSAVDYAVTLDAGTYDERFILEISPIEQIETGVEAVTGDGLQVTGVCKKLIDGVLYIVKDGKVFDARGARIQ